MMTEPGVDRGRHNRDAASHLCDDRRRHARPGEELHKEPAQLIETYVRRDEVE